MQNHPRGPGFLRSEVHSVATGYMLTGRMSVSARRLYVIDVEPGAGEHGCGLARVVLRLGIYQPNFCFIISTWPTVNPGNLQFSWVAGAHITPGDPTVDG